MFPRILSIQNHSFFLFGPRGTGKSTWIQGLFKDAHWYNLLDSREVIRLSKDPSLLYRELGHLKPNSWVVIDEVQKVPSLLNEVHRLIEEKKIKFVLSGSSARKLKKEGANLLAGRAVTKHLYPLIQKELDFTSDLNKVFQFGTLPLAITSEDPKNYLRTYAETYLQEEIRAEALVRNIGGFARFLEVAARQNAQVTNVANISKEAEVARQTVQGYFDILVDTLIGFWLPAWKLKRSTRQKALPKFYFFDCGIARALSGRLPYTPSHEELGHLVETAMINELKAFLDYTDLHYPLFYWSSAAGVEVDAIFETDHGYICLEVKASRTWDTKFNKGLSRLQQELSGKKIKAYGIYLGDRQACYQDILIYPYIDFFKALWTGKIFSF